MRKLLALILVLIISNAHAQSPKSRARMRRAPAQNSVQNGLQSAKPMSPAPVFLARQGAASINEMMVQPPTFNYGSSINIWVIVEGEGKDKKIREIEVTGHGDSPTCRRVSGMIMNMLLDKFREPDDMFVAGAAHLIDRGNASRREILENDPDVQHYLETKSNLILQGILAQTYRKTPGAGTTEKSLIEQIQEELNKLKHEIDEISKNKMVEEYVRESRSADALSVFTSEVKAFSQGNGLVNVHEVPYGIVKKAKARLTSSVRAGTAEVIAFDDLLAESDTREAALITPVLMIPTGQPLQLKVPLARMAVSSFEDARRNNRDEVESAIMGNARQRIVVYNQAKQRYLKEQDTCKRIPHDKLGEVIQLTNALSVEGVGFKKDKPTTMTIEAYCKVQIPINIITVNEWISHTRDIIKSVDKDAEQKQESRIQEANYNTLIDSMLRDWRLPVARSQSAFDTWSKNIRGPVWASLTQQLQQMGIATNLIGGEQMIFHVRLVGKDLFISPMHVIDMARSVIVADPAAKVTTVVDAWSLRSNETPTESQGVQPQMKVVELISGAFARLAKGDRESAHEQIVAAFSLDPAAAFKELEKQWLALFPDTHQKLLEVQQKVQPAVEAAEWKDAYERLKANPETKEGLREYITAFHDMLESYSKAPVDLHLKFALELASVISEFQNQSNKNNGGGIAQPQLNAWDIIEAYSRLNPSRPLAQSPHSGRINAKALQQWRKDVGASLQLDGFQGQGLNQMLNVLQSIETSENFTQTERDKYIKGRKWLSLSIHEDPAPLIFKAVQTVAERDPEYWIQARKERDLPKERSREWLASDETTNQPLTLFESGALNLMRLEDGLRKSYWGAQAARYLWSTDKPDLNALSYIIDSAIGDDRTGSSSAYIGPKASVKLFLNQKRTMDMLTRVQNASSLQSGSEALIAIAQSQMPQDDSLEPFSDHISLNARTWFESGDYLKAFNALFVNKIPIALYHPDIRWQALPGDVIGKPLSVKARREGENILFAAEIEADKPVDVLAISGLSGEDVEALLKEFTELKEPDWSDTGKVSEQILMTTLSPRPMVQAMNGLLRADDVRLRVLKSMIYGRTAPGENHLRTPDGKVNLNQAVTTLDQVVGDRGARYKVPTITEVKQVAADKILKRK